MRLFIPCKSLHLPYPAFVLGELFTSATKSEALTT